MHDLFIFGGSSAASTIFGHIVPESLRYAKNVEIPCSEIKDVSFLFTREATLMDSCIFSLQAVRSFNLLARKICFG